MKENMESNELKHQTVAEYLEDIGVDINAEIKIKEKVLPLTTSTEPIHKNA